MPSRLDVDPLTVPRAALAHVMLIDVEWPTTAAASGMRLRYRLVGTGVVASREGLTPHDPTGWYLDEIPFRQGDIVARHYGGVAETGRPAYRSGVYAPDHPRLAGTFHRLGLPLSATGERVTMVFAGFCRGERP
jgi:hypothetical protein